MAVTVLNIFVKSVVFFCCICSPAIQASLWNLLLVNNHIDIAIDLSSICSFLTFAYILFRVRLSFCIRYSINLWFVTAFLWLDFFEQPSLVHTVHICSTSHSHICCPAVSLASQSQWNVYISLCFPTISPYFLQPSSLTLLYPSQLKPPPSSIVYAYVFCFCGWPLWMACAVCVSGPSTCKCVSRLAICAQYVPYALSAACCRWPRLRNSPTNWRICCKCLSLSSRSCWASGHIWPLTACSTEVRVTGPIQGLHLW